MLTCEKFQIAAKELAALELDWYGGQSKWTWIAPNNPSIENALCNGYICLTLTRSLHQAPSSSVECDILVNKEDDDVAVPTSTPPVNLSRWQFHVCYSQSYQEPVLYFEAHDQYGSPLPMSTVLESLSLGNGGEAEADGIQGGDAFPAVTQEEHPSLYRPFYMLHPCQTGAIMSVLKNSDNEAAAEDENEQEAVAALKYLLSWLCFAGQPLGIAPSPEEWLELSTRVGIS